MRKHVLCASLVVCTAALGFAPSALAAPGKRSREFVVVLKQGTSATQARKAVRAAGGTIVRLNRRVGVATVRSRRASFARRARAQTAVVGASRHAVVGRAPDARAKRARAIEQAPSRGATPAAAPVPSGDQLSGLQWDMAMIGATPSGSYASEPGSHAVSVGVIDTGIDGGHPDIAPNFNRALSRNFTVDNPVPGIEDGPCEVPSCVDPPDVDGADHGTHVAGTIAAALNGIGISGVAPGAQLVNLRAGQDAGFFLLQPTVDALTYAADNGIDVVNMSYYIDPWLFNCTANPADSPERQAEQRTIIQATQRALSYARAGGVTLVSAAGNESKDLGAPGVDDTSPDFPEGTGYERTIDNSTCLTLPAEGRGVVTVSSVGPVNPAVSPYPRKSFYSNYGTEQITVAAPGGDSREFFGTPQYNAPQNRILSPYPLSHAQECGEVDSGGVPNGQTTCDVPAPGPRPVPLVRDCYQGTCALYQWAQGTSMASPHAAGVVAVIVAAHGRRDRAHGGLTLDPSRVERILRRTATNTPCPPGDPFTYPEPASAGIEASCEGGPGFNGFYGDGIVNAFAASQ